MQINGIGSEHNSNHHNVTNCLHEHTVGKKEGGVARSGSLDSLTLSNQNTMQEHEGRLSLSAWLDKTLNSGKDLLQRIWGSDQTVIKNGTGGQSMEAQVLAAMDDGGVATGVGADTSGQANYGTHSQSAQSMPLHAPWVAAATTTVQAEQNRMAQQNPYFAAVGDDGKRETLWQKMKVKLKDAAGKLTGHLPGHFAGFQAPNSMSTKQEQHKEDLRKRSKYRQNEVEIDCVLTDDSYLQDSYNNRGEYSKLAGDMRGNMNTRR